MAMERDGFEMGHSSTGTTMDHAISDYMTKHSLVTVDPIEDIGVPVLATPNGSCGVGEFYISS